MRKCFPPQLPSLVSPQDTEDVHSGVQVCFACGTSEMEKQMFHLFHRDSVSFVDVYIFSHASGKAPFMAALVHHFGPD